MRVAVAIVIAGALIASAILIAFHWQIIVGPGVVYRLDRWTGSATVCNSEAYRDCAKVLFGE